MEEEAGPSSPAITGGAPTPVAEAVEAQLEVVRRFVEDPDAVALDPIQREAMADLVAEEERRQEEEELSRREAEW